MTKKQFSFNVNKNQIEYDNKYYAFCNVIDANKIVNSLNDFIIEKRMLELEIEGLEAIIKTGNCSLLQKENEQLKEQIQQLDNTIAIHLELQNEKDKGFDKLHKMLMESYNENDQLKKEIEYLDEKIKEEEWHWNTIDEDRDVWKYKCNEFEKENSMLKEKICAIQQKLNQKIEKIKKVNDLLKQTLLLEENCAEEYNIDAMNFEVLYNQQKEINDQLKKEIDSYKPVIFKSEDGDKTLYKKIGD